MVNIIFNWDKSVTDAGARGFDVKSFEGAISAAGKQYENIVKDQITLTCNVGLGMIGGVAMNASDGGTGGPLRGTSLPYDQVIAELKAHTNNPSVLAQLATLPLKPPADLANLYISPGEAKIWGLEAKGADGPNGQMGFSNLLQYAYGNRAQPGKFDLQGMAFHEIGHALFGRTYGGVEQLGHYTSPGVLAGVNKPGYFSENGGKTSLGQFSAVDTGDWAKSGDGDPYNLMTLPGIAETNITPEDYQLISFDGFKVNQVALDPELSMRCFHNSMSFLHHRDAAYTHHHQA